jgi:hypothetical protein
MVGDVVSAWKIEMAEEVLLSIDGWGELILLSHCGEGRSYSTLFPIRLFKSTERQMVYRIELMPGSLYNR